MIHTQSRRDSVVPARWTMFDGYLSPLLNKLTVSFFSPQSLESTRRMLQLVEEVRKQT